VVREQRDRALERRALAACLGRVFDLQGVDRKAADHVAVEPVARGADQAAPVELAERSLAEVVDAGRGRVVVVQQHHRHRRLLVFVLLLIAELEVIVVAPLAAATAPLLVLLLVVLRLAREA
jgi:hypothetical protein